MMTVYGTETFGENAPHVKTPITLKPLERIPSNLTHPSAIELPRRMSLCNSSDQKLRFFGWIEVQISSVITFRMSRRRREMYRGHSHLCVCPSLSLSATACPHHCTDQDVTWESGRECPLVVHYWADLQSVHGLRCYGNITRTRNVSEYMLVLAVRTVIIIIIIF